MMKIIFLLIMVSSALMLCSSCKKQNEAVPLVLQKPLEHSAEYYANLRAYKSRPHEVFFGWWSNPRASTDQMSLNFLAIPDSVDMVSLVSGVPVKGSEAYNQMQYCREVKGTKFLIFSNTDSELLNRWSGVDFEETYDNKGDSVLKAGFDMVAKIIYDTAVENGMDGLDMDHEPSFCGCGAVWGPTRDVRKFRMYINSLAKYFGPKSGTGKILDVDGEWYRISPGLVDSIDYGVEQAYNANAAGLQTRYRTGSASTLLPPGKFIATETIQGQSDGGINFVDPIHGTIPSLLGFAYWQPVQGKKGGAGAWLFNTDYFSTPVPYRYVREAIQIMNPAVAPQIR